jgi:predicted phage baseplate assembly protein
VAATPNPEDTAGQSEWTDFTIGPQPAGPEGGYIDLDGVLGEVRAGSLVVLAKGEYNRPDESFPPGTYVELYVVTSTAEVSRAEFAMSGKVTRLGLSGQHLDTHFLEAVRETTVFAQSEALRLAPALVQDKVAGAQLPLALPPDGLVAGRRLIVHGDHVDGDGNLVHKVHEATISSVARAPNGTLLTIAPPLPEPLERATVVVHANVASATHGETGAQILGSGDAGRGFQRFELTRLPLTWRSGSDAPELSVRVGDVEWACKPTLFGAAAAERAYTLAVDEQGKNWVVFGDGVRGARLPAGVSNVRASYRQGLGRGGNVASDKLTQLMTRPLGLKSVSNPVAARGGVDPEPAGQARRAMPLGTRTLGRVVSVLDYEDFALGFSDFAKAQARVLQLRAGPTIAVTVAGADGAELSSSDAAWNRLLAAFKAGGDPHVNLALLSYRKKTFHLGLKVKRDPAYETRPLLAAVKAALLAHFAFDARSLGQPVLHSEVVAVAHSVRGVVAVDLDLLYAGAAQARLLASQMHVSGGVAMPAELLVLEPASFDLLEEMP